MLLYQTGLPQHGSKRPRSNIATRLAAFWYCNNAFLRLVSKTQVTASSAKVLPHVVFDKCLEFAVLQIAVLPGPSRMAIGHIRNTPTRRSGNGALSDAAIARASTVRVSAGSMMPSSHNRAVL